MAFLKAPINGMKVRSKRSQVHSSCTKVHAKPMKVHGKVSWCRSGRTGKNGTRDSRTILAVIHQELPWDCAGTGTPWVAEEAGRSWAGAVVRWKAKCLKTELQESVSLDDKEKRRCKLKSAEPMPYVPTRAIRGAMTKPWSRWWPPFANSASRSPCWCAAMAKLWMATCG